MPILPDDVRAKQDAERRAARKAAAVAAAEAAPSPKRVGVQRTTFRAPRPPAPKEPLPCMCGCGERPRSRYSRFLPGHDARYHARLKRASVKL